ncbi:MAG: metalloregulator ArsR/SmtB family transcription factor [Brasilonema octagenarum HA4186-MV1]|jgi:ATP-dependent Clp protease ATP-binding subunit ClpC|uniref:Clp protease n=2 Tax=Brasilonema TaxID=383614 RepID=A0A856ME15_9CYAN|nr:metalloregulator ArsR/SmtB family transcription factor [Brasilonema octagenarum HA4186-MV1]NMF67158.1 Clp protease [Brasilonema octagenarum UFV-OR1]QDL09555.1 Clp protease [Brasilonema sennae CENA114]QDL15911.1 Clp protease [Brasilonema octagenarum UFV-E1]
MENQETARYADMFAALGSEPRLEIMRLLFAAYPEGMTVGEIQEKLKIPNSTLSHHLEKLRNEELVKSRKDKQFLWYSANAKTMEDLLAFLTTDRSRREGDRVSNEHTLEPANKTPIEEGFMFEKFFESIFHKLSGSFSDRFHLKGFERFTQKAINAINLAQGESRRLGHNFVGTEQILLGLLGEGSGIGWQFLNSVGVNLENAQIEVEKIIGRGKGDTAIDIPFTPRAKQVLELAVEDARYLNVNYVGTEHLLLGILHEGGGVAIRVLQSLGVDLISLEQRLRRTLT